ncbi:uncharacterized protein PG998_005106 [Apiospora kogelbergensis]|uniref:uncharacterized protein n=1 Tax=Apiospora kogelbergensis TaxID=1337665 RepID=UPI00312E91CD
MAGNFIKSLLAVALSLNGASATQVFANRGTMSGWDTYNHEHKGKVQEANNPVFPDITKQGTSLSMTQVYDKNWKGRYHSEAVKYNVYKKGDTGFYGFAFRLQDDWEFTKGLSFNLAQFIADFTSLGCSETYMPSTMVWLEGDQLNARVKHGDVCPQEEQKTTFFRKLATVTPGAWHRVEIQASWRSDDSGYFKIWYDGKKVNETFGIPTTVTDSRPFQFRVFYDQIAVGTEFADAAPDKW